MTFYGGIITRRPLCYTADGRLIVAPCGNDIRVYSAKSGEHIATLRGHTAEVTAVAEDPGSSSALLLSSSYDGSIKQWDLQEGIVQQTWHVGTPIESMVYSKAAGVAYVSISHKGGQAGRVVPYHIPSGQAGQGKIKTSAAGRLVISPSGRYVAVLDRRSCFVIAAGSSATGARAKPLNLPHTKSYMCAAFDPKDGSIALGDSSGRIVVWHNFTRALNHWTSSAATAASASAAAGSSGGSSGGGQLPPCTTVHWHASAVGAVCYSLDGSLLLSGGQEGALVVWSLTALSRNYLPRLGGPIRGIATCAADPARLCLSQGDNTVRLVNTAAMIVEVSIHGLRPPPPAAALAAAGYGSCCSAASSSPAGVVLQPSTGHVVLPAEHATLQFFDINRDRHIAHLQVCPRNPVVTAPSNQAALAAAAGLDVPPALVPAVVLAAFTADSSSLVTVDVRPSTSAYAGATESTLRFWDVISRSQVAGSRAPYLLNTSTDNPHTGSITGLACHPTQPMAVTTGSAGEFRLWARAAAAAHKGSSAAAGGGGSSSGSDGTGHWRCAAVGSYKGQPLNCCSFSSDGSVLAVGAGATATLWDPHDTSLIASLVPPTEFACSRHQLRQLLFLRNSPHLVGVYGGGDPNAAMQSVGLFRPWTAGVHAEGPAQQEQQQEQPGPGQQAQKKKKQEQAEQQQGPQHYAQLVAHGWAHGIVVWNLLTGNVSWFCSLPVCSAAADPVHPVFAVGVPAVLDHSSSSSSSHAGSDEAADGQQQQQSERQQGLVLVFGDKQAEPLYACTVPDSSPSSLLFWPGKAAAAPAGADSAAARVSPLMLLTQDRRYTRVNLGGSSSSSSSDGSAAAAAEAEAAVQGTKAALAAEAAANGEGRSALESMFGKTEAPAATAAAADGSSAAAAAAAVKAAVSQLFDAPSHVLPAPSSLCPTLLDLLIGAGQQGSR